QSASGICWFTSFNSGADGELETIDTANWLPKVMRKDYIVGFSPVAGGPDPEQNLYLNYACGGELNYNGGQDVPGALDILGGKGLAIVPSDPVAQWECQFRSVLVP